MISNWQITLAVIIVGLSIVMPIYYSYQRKKKAQQEELNKIKVYGESISTFIEKYFNILALLFTFLLIGGFILIKIILS